MVIQALQSLKHKNLPKLREYFIESHHNYLIYDLVEGASLNNYIQKNVLSKVQIYKIMKDLIQLVQYLHREGFSHQNIKLEKIFYCSMTDEITLVDFEQQRKISDQMSQRQIYSMSTLSSKDYTDLNVFSNNEIQTEKDYLDCGLVFFQLITQRILTNQEIISSSENRQIQQFINEIHNKHVSKFIMKLFNYSKLQSQEKQHFCQDIDELISSKRKNQIFF